jgi:hypothetical protein
MQPETKHESRGATDRSRIGRVATLAIVSAWERLSAVRPPGFIDVEQLAARYGLAEAKDSQGVRRCRIDRIERQCVENEECVATGSLEGW